MTAVALCADAESLRRPDLIGLAGEHLAGQEWLRLFASAEDARRCLRSDRSVGEAWVAGCDDIEPINLAAALKRDRPDLRVCLLAFQGTGSLMSRASAAGIDASLTRQAFAERYAEAKRSHAAPGEARSGSGPLGGGRPGWEQAGTRAGAAQRATGAGPWRGGARPVPAEGAWPVPAEGAWPADARVAAAQAAAAWAADGRAPSGDLHGARPAALPQQPYPGQPAVAAPVGGGAQEPRSAVRSVPSPRVERRPAAASHPAFVMPVVSGSGGAGKSTVSVLSALFAQGLGYKTLLLDFDLQFGDARDLLGVPDAPGIDEVLAAPGCLARLEPDGLLPALLAAPKRLEDAEAVVREAPRLLDELLARFDVVVANTGAAWGEEHALLLERSSKALFLVDQRPSSLRACRHALDLCARCGIATGPFLFAANRCAKGALLTSLDVSCALRGAPAIELADGGGEVEELMGAGQSLDLIAAKNGLCTSLEHALVDILPGCEGRALRVAEPRAARPERRFGRRRRRGKRGVPCPC